MLDKEKLNAERQSLYSDIDRTIGNLVKVRLDHDTQKEVDALHMMETLMVQTQQLLDCMGEMFEPTPIDEDLEKTADDYADKHGFRVLYDASKTFYDDVDVKASREGFIAGAQWKEEQILQNADEYIIDDEKIVTDFYLRGNRVGKPVLFGSAPEGINVGDVVKVVVIKQNKAQ